MNAEQNSGEQYEKKIADERASRAEARVPNCCLALGIVKTSQLGVGCGIGRCFGSPHRCWLIGPYTRACLSNHLGAHCRLTLRLCLVDLEVRDIASHPPVAAAIGTNGITQIECGIHDLLERDQHHYDGDEANRVAIRLRNTTIHPVHFCSPSSGGDGSSLCCILQLIRKRIWIRDGPVTGVAPAD